LNPKAYDQNRELDIDLSIATKYEEFQHPNMEKTGSDINEDLPDEEVG